MARETERETERETGTETETEKGIETKKGTETKKETETESEEETDCFFRRPRVSRCAGTEMASLLEAATAGQMSGPGYA